MPSPRLRSLAYTDTPETQFVSPQYVAVQTEVPPPPHHLDTGLVAMVGPWLVALARALEGAAVQVGSKRSDGAGHGRVNFKRPLASRGLHGAEGSVVALELYSRTAGICAWRRCFTVRGR